MHSKNRPRLRMKLKAEPRSGLYYLVKFLLRSQQNIPSFNNILFTENIANFLENFGINKYIIEMKKGKQLLFRSIYRLRPVELKTLKTYIKNNLANGFICFFKSSIKALILFNRKSDNSFWFYANCQDLNNLTIKNQYLLLLISNLLYWFGQAKRVTKLDFINAYHEIRICESEKSKTAFQT